MKDTTIRWILYAVLFLLFVLHNDLWLWNDATIVMGMPIGFLYHVLYCFAVSGAMYLLLKYAWPADLTSKNREQK